MFCEVAERPARCGRAEAAAQARSRAAAKKAAAGWRFMILSLDSDGPAWQAAHGGENMTTQIWLWGAAGAALLLVAASGVAESRRNRRRSLHRPGWVPGGGPQAGPLFPPLPPAPPGWEAR